MAWCSQGNGTGCTPNVCFQTIPAAGCIDMTYWANYARAHNKPLMIGEFCDEFNDGYDTQQMINFLIQNNGVYLGMWDSDTGTIGNPPGLGNCHITDTVHNGGQTGVPPSPVTLTKMNQLFGGTNYTRRFFQPYLPPPVPNPLGF